MDNWQNLCELIDTLIKGDVVEDIFHSQFEKCLKIFFNWDDTSLQHKPSVKMGRETKEADIVLKGENFGIVIEMKRPSIVLGNEEARQLTSYMRILGYKYGLLIGNEIKVFYDEDTNGNDPIEVASFGFDSNNADGMALSEILDKSVCSNEKLKEYAVERVERGQVKKRLEVLKAELVSNNGEKIKRIVKEKLVTEGYNECGIDGILEDILITVKKPDDTIKTGGGEPPHPSDTLILEFVPNDEIAFKRQLIETKRAEHKIFYSNGTFDTKPWNAYQFDETSGLRNNILSKFRDWRKLGIEKIITEIT